MSGIVGLSIKISKQQNRVIQRARRSTLRNVKYGAGIVRRTARRSMRKRKKASKPGNPPSAHDGRLKKSIWFTLIKNKTSAMIGPRNENWFTELHEFGGTKRTKKYQGLTVSLGGIGPIATKQNGDVQWIMIRTGAQLFRASSMLDSLKATEKTITAKYPARPYMRPALEESQETIMQFWAKSVF